MPAHSTCRTDLLAFACLLVFAWALFVVFLANGACFTSVLLLEVDVGVTDAFGADVEIVEVLAVSPSDMEFDGTVAGPLDVTVLGAIDVVAEAEVVRLELGEAEVDVVAVDVVSLGDSGEETWSICASGPKSPKSNLECAPLAGPPRPRPGPGSASARPPGALRGPDPGPQRTRPTSVARPRPTQSLAVTLVASLATPRQWPTRRASRREAPVGKRSWRSMGSASASDASLCGDIHLWAMAVNCL